MPRPQITLRALLVLMLAVACFFGGIWFERERRRRADEAETHAALQGRLIRYSQGICDVRVGDDGHKTHVTLGRVRRATPPSAPED